MAILRGIRNSTAYRLYGNGKPKDTLSNRGSDMAEVILRAEILNFEKSIFGQKKDEISVEVQWPLRRYNKGRYNK